MQRRGYLMACATALVGSVAGCDGRSDGGGSNSTDATPAIPETVDGQFTGFQAGPRHLGRATGSIDGSLSEVWTHSEPSDPTGHQVGTPAVANGWVYFPEGTIEGEEATGYLTALDLQSGEVDWQYEFPGTNAVDDAVYADGLVLQRFSGSLVAIDAETGGEEWRLDADLDTTPTVADGTVYVLGRDIGGTTLYALDVGSGSEHWTREFDGGRGALQTPAVADGTVYNVERQVVGLDAADGNEQWTGAAERRPVTAPTVAEGTVYVGTEGNGVAAIDRDSGEQLWWTEVTSAATGGRGRPVSPAVDGGTVVTASAWAGTALDADSGDHRWSKETGVDGPPVVADGSAVIAGLDQVRVYDVETGSLLTAHRTDNDSGSSVSAAVVDGVVLYPSNGLHALVVT